MTCPVTGACIESLTGRASRSAGRLRLRLRVRHRRSLAYGLCTSVDERSNPPGVFGHIGRHGMTCTINYRIEILRGRPQAPASPGAR